ncbi:MAG: response regulator [Desulfomicrobium sp.]|nr:response regulator [Pseudomonadota bacterium]MBV1711782.1 response regulator [Desulfomicrobium sp.]MBU4572630.1 response regulator [Pseudomonadota bacterium]MBU4593589.1 response regulator [Pseudomonadota bacterium]MBV1719156.1 response regulator [Desulfomicrobium sp.]
MSAGKKILIVDDEPHNLLLLKTFLVHMGHEVAEASNGIDALKNLGADIDLVLSDVMMPGMNGFELLRRMREIPDFDDVPVIIVTTLGDKSSRLKAVQAGAMDYISKPLDPLELRVRVDAGLRMKQKSDKIRKFQSELADMVEERTLALNRALAELRESNLDMVYRLAAAAESKDPETAAHLLRMSNYCAMLAQKLGLPSDEVDIILHASPLHDIGKIAIPDAILMKPGPLDESEWQIMRTHTLHGARILDKSPNRILQVAEEIARTHHEWFDGSGYPGGLKGTGIPLLGRLSAVADVFDALTSPRPYKAPLFASEAADILREGRGTHFDPELLDLFLESFDEVLTIKQKFGDSAPHDLTFHSNQTSTDHRPG